ncbi:MAG: radical SAM protein [Candidatus Delongbacteria bacterium]
MALKVNEIFTSLQGESSFAGLPCLFIRLTGCNLRCGWCDTKYAYDEGRDYSGMELVGLINDSNIKLVEFTGGEPLLQKEELIRIIGDVDRQKTILIETNGSISLEGLPERVLTIADYKLKGSGEGGSFLEKNMGFLRKKDEIKFVLKDFSDYNEMRECYMKYDLGSKCGVLVSKIWNAELSDGEIAEAILKDRLNVRYQIQLHKYIWKDEKGR